MKTFILILSAIVLLNFSSFSQGAGMLLNFDGTDDYVTVDSVCSDVAGTDFTVEAWFRSDSIFAAVFAFNQADGSNRFLIYNQAIFALDDGENRFFYNQPAVNEWNYIAVSLENGLDQFLNVYINGVKDISVLTSERVSAADLASIGQEWDQGMITSAHLNGSIDEVRVSDVALSLQEIRERMHLRLLGSGPGLVGYWRFDEGTGSTAGDSSGFDNDGLLINGPAWDYSTAPFGSGTANTQVISSTGPVLFQNTDLEFDITDKTGTDTFVVARINNEPGGTLPPNNLIDDVYWVAEKYGEGSFQADLSFTFETGVLPASQVIKLYGRSSRSDGDWNMLGTASDISDTIVTFNGITETGQFVITVDTATGIENDFLSGPLAFSLMQNYPNPFNPATILSFVIGHSSFVTLKVYDVLGNEVATLVNEYKPAGRYNVEFIINNENLSSGVYFYKLQAGSYSAVRKMILMK